MFTELPVVTQVFIVVCATVAVLGLLYFFYKMR